MRRLDRIVICGVLLAAGGARRFGGKKLLAKLPDGLPVVTAAARNLKGALNHVVAVVRPGEAELSKLLIQEGLDTVACAEAWRGMGASLAFGVSIARDADGWIVALADMPQVQRQTIMALAQAIASGTALAAPYFAGRRGHPVAFGKKYLDDLLQLDGDQGARTLLARDSRELVRIDTHDPGILIDIDTPDQLAKL
ncbi:MAG TPA: nucleotidyltransferase family protein [Burkholderiales bacterium]|nr:nucleotidyltransferase family protein [Burkholderiales bacterium]